MEGLDWDLHIQEELDTVLRQAETWDRVAGLERLGKQEQTWCRAFLGGGRKIRSHFPTQLRGFYGKLSGCFPFSFSDKK